MPIFEFVCRDCSSTFEDLMTFAEMEAGAAKCPCCGSAKVMRNLSAFATGPGGGSSGGSCGTGGFT